MGERHCEAFARTSRAWPPGAEGLGDVRLGQLGVPDDHHRRGLPHLLPQRRRRRSRRPPVDEPVRLGDDDRDRDRGAGGAATRRDRRLRGDEEEDARRFRRDRRRRDAGDVLDSRGRLAVRADAVRHRQRRGRRQHRVLRVAASASGQRAGARPCVVGRIRHRLSRWRRAARHQPADDPAAGLVRHRRHRNGRAAVACERRDLVVGVLDPALPPRARSRRAGSRPTKHRAPASSARARGAWSKRSANCGASNRRSCCSSRSSFTTTASRPSSGWRRRSAARSASIRAR